MNAAQMLPTFSDLIRAAFGHDDEANLVDQLRDADALAVSLVLSRR